jgi:tetratricopeptide (TPR) repeat protein/DNA-binding CsgD family transcriptional regulator
MKGNRVCFLFTFVPIFLIMQSSRILYRSLLPLLLAFTANCFSQDKAVLDSITMQLKKAEQAHNDTLIATELSELARLHSVNNPELALKLSKRQLAISKKANYNWGIGNAFNIQGGIYTDRGNYDKALALYGQAIKVFNEMGRDMDVIDINNSIGIIYAKKGIYTEALKYTLKGLQLAIKYNDGIGIYSTYNTIGSIYESQKEYGKALDYYLRCLKMQQKLGRGNYEQVTLGNIGQIYLLRKQPALAMKYYQEGIDSAIDEYDDYSLANNYAGIGNMYIQTSQWENALTNHNLALGLRNRMDDSFGITSSYLSLADIFYNKKEYDKALSYTIAAQNNIKNTGELVYQVKIHEQLSKIYESMGSYRPAYEHYKLYKQFNDSIFNTENAKKLTEQHMNFEFKLRQEKKDAAAKLALKEQKDIRNYTIAALLLTAVFGFVLFRQRYKLAAIKKQKDHEAAIKNVESEMALKELESQALKAENKNILLEEEKLQQKLDFNQRELATATMYLYQRSELLAGLRREVDNLYDSAHNPKELEKIKSALQNDYYAEADWEKFRVHFEQVHPDFFKNLSEQHPDLTPYEIRLCAYIHLNMSAKEIAGLLNIATGSVHKAKMRLNKKMGRNGDEKDENNGLS